MSEKLWDLLDVDYVEDAPATNELENVENNTNKDLLIADTVVEKIQNAESFDMYDDEDHKIDKLYNNIYNEAMTAYSQQMEAIKDIEPKYSARNVEVANALLTTALQAAKAKSVNKGRKHEIDLREKAIKAKQDENNNHVVIIDRNDLLKMINNENEEKVIGDDTNGTG